MENIAIKQVSLKEVETLQQISRKTFTQTFSENNVAENMNKYLEESFSVAKLTEEVSNAASQFYFALLDNKVIGYLKLNTGRAQTELKDERGLEIERIYVLKNYHGQKVGQLLYDKAIAIARELRSD